MRGSVIEYRQTNPLKPGYLSFIQEIVWGTTSDDDGRDMLEIGKFGCKGYVYLDDISGVEINDKILEDYGFIRINNMSNLITYYRDDFGYVKLDAYGVEHVYMKGKCIKYLHSFQRVFFDYTGKILFPHKSEQPKKEFKSAFEKEKTVTAEDVLENIEKLKSIALGDNAPGISFEF